MKLHHVAFAEGPGAPLVGTLERLFGLTVESTEQAAGFVERMLRLDNCALQGLEASGESVVSRFVERRGPGLHHIAFEVDDIDRALSRLGEDGIRLIDRQPRVGGGGHRIAFVHPSAMGGVLVELVQESLGDAVRRPSGPPPAVSADPCPASEPSITTFSPAKTL